MHTTDGSSRRQIKSKSSIDCTARVCMPHTIDLVAFENIWRAMPLRATLPLSMLAFFAVAAPELVGPAAKDDAPVPVERGCCGEDGTAGETVVVAVAVGVCKLITEPNAAKRLTARVFI